ncbi:MAG: hypothetical protein NTV01_06565 [Bacteroidia bacterium]|nr:hypothetical protein [Bacteroidia bacterium]
MLRTEKLKAVSSVKIKKYHSILPGFMLRTQQKGSILIGLIITMVIMASLGAGMLYLTTTSTFHELMANNNVRAYYAAESGGRQALAVIRDAYANYSEPDRTTSLAAVDSKVFQMSNGDQFQISALVRTASYSGGPETVIFTSTGIVSSGLLRAKRQITYQIQPANQTGGGGGGTGGPTVLNKDSVGDNITYGGEYVKDKDIKSPYSGKKDKSGSTYDGVTINVKAKKEGEDDTDKGIVFNGGWTQNFTGNYDVQVKTNTPGKDRWQTGIFFNQKDNPGGYPYGYGLSFFYNWHDSGFTGLLPFTNATTPSYFFNGPSVSRIADTGAYVLVLLWQSAPTTVPGDNKFDWIAYRTIALGNQKASSAYAYPINRMEQPYASYDDKGKLKNSNTYDVLIREDPKGTGNDVWRLKDTDTDKTKDFASTILVRVSNRSATRMDIRAYYGSPADHQGTANKIATDDNRLIYNVVQKTILSDTDFNWPLDTAAWTAANDYFTLVTWDAINSSVTTVSNLYTSGAEQNAVIRTTALIDKAYYKSISLQADGDKGDKDKDQFAISFFNFATRIPVGTADGSGAVIQY